MGHRRFAQAGMIALHLVRRDELIGW